MSQLNYKAPILARARRVVVKVGSAVLSGPHGLNSEVIDRLAVETESAIRGGREVIVVTSGAIAAGRARLSRLGDTSIAARQAAAAAGQIDFGDPIALGRCLTQRVLLEIAWFI